MEVLHPRCAGLAIHKDSAVACARIAERARGVRPGATFASTSGGLERSAAWLKSPGATHVAMEGTGLDWTPVCAVLCEEMAPEPALPEPARVTARPGRK